MHCFGPNVTCTSLFAPLFSLLSSASDYSYSLHRGGGVKGLMTPVVYINTMKSCVGALLNRNKYTIRDSASVQNVLS